MAARRGRRGYPPDRSELLSRTDRAKYLGALRVGLGTIAIGAVALWPELTTVSPIWLAVGTAGYLAVSGGLLALSARGGSIAMAALHGGLLLDGIYLAAMIGLTAGASSPLRLLLCVHVVAVTLLCSYRTGLKLALWDTVLFLLVVEAIQAGLVSTSDPTVDAAREAALTIAALWLLALGTAAFSAASERALRRQKASLTDLSLMVARIDTLEPSDAAARAIAGIFLDQVRTTFGFTKGVVLASPEGALEVLATTETGPRSPVEGMDEVMSRAWAQHAPQLVRSIDQASDPRLATLLPSARNVMVVPLFLVGGQRLGIAALERGDNVDSMRRWDVEMVGQFAAHTALALYNAWLTEERESQLETIRGLERRLRAHNTELEVTVAERTEELRRVIRELEEIDDQRRRLLDHVVRAAEDERHRIANDIHDDPVQKLVAVKMRLEMLAATHPDLPEISEALETMASTVSSMRHLLFDLSPPILDEEGIGSALRYFLENSSSPFRWSVEDDIEHQPPVQTRLILYRTAQEALTNARKHSDASVVNVRLHERDGGLWMAIEDDGVGFEPREAAVAAPGHLGLAAIRERAEMAGGWCALRSLPGAGTSLEVWLPRDATAADEQDIDSEDDLARVIPLQFR